MSRIPPDVRDVLAIFDLYKVTNEVKQDWHGNKIDMEDIANQVCDAVDKHYEHLKFLKDLIMKQEEIVKESTKEITE